MASNLPNPSTTLKPLNPLALPYPKSPPQMEPHQQPSLLPSKPNLPHQIYHFQPTPIQPHHPSALTLAWFPPPNMFFSSPTFIYQNNLNFPVWTHPLTLPPQVANLFYTYSLEKQRCCPPSEEKKEENFGGSVEVDKSIEDGRVIGCKSIKRREKRHNLPPRFRASKIESCVSKEKPTKEAVFMKERGGGGGGGGGEEKGEVGLGEKTSLMIRNIPNQLLRHHLMGILDKHCLEENKALFGSGQVRSEYDFLYLPMDFMRRANLGYAFVNFTSEVAASRFWRAFNGYKWRVAQSQKTCEITFAMIQGNETLKRHFTDSKFPCHTNSYLPVLLSPPRDGSTQSPPIVVGKRVTSPFRLPTIINQKNRT